MGHLQENQTYEQQLPKPWKPDIQDICNRVFNSTKCINNAQLLNAFSEFEQASSGWNLQALLYCGWPHRTDEGIEAIFARMGFDSPAKEKISKPGDRKQAFLDYFAREISDRDDDSEFNRCIDLIAHRAADTENWLEYDVLDDRK